jgi:hypothetical protein
MKKIIALVLFFSIITTLNAQMLPNIGPYPKTTKNATCNSSAAIKNYSAKFMLGANGAINLVGNFNAEKGKVTEVSVQFGRSMRKSVCIKDTVGQKTDTTFSKPEYFLVTQLTTSTTNPTLSVSGNIVKGSKDPNQSIFALKSPGSDLSASVNSFSIPMNLPPNLNPKCREEFETYVTVQVKFADGCVISQLLVAKGKR